MGFLRIGNHYLNVDHIHSCEVKGEDQVIVHVEGMEKLTVRGMDARLVLDHVENKLVAVAPRAPAVTAPPVSAAKPK